jgi:hypothetical protein
MSGTYLARAGSVTGPAGLEVYVERMEREGISLRRFRSSRIAKARALLAITESLVV